MQTKRGFRQIAARTLEHSFECALAVVFVMLAVGLLLDHHQLGIAHVHQLPVPLVVGWEAGLFIGGGCLAAGIIWPWSPTTGYGVERAGLYVGGATWFTYGLALLKLGGESTLPALLEAAAITLGCAGRIVWSHKIEKSAEGRMQADGRGDG